MSHSYMTSERGKFSLTPIDVGVLDQNIRLVVELEKRTYTHAPPASSVLPCHATWERSRNIFVLVENEPERLWTAHLRVIFNVSVTFFGVCQRSFHCVCLPVPNSCVAYSFPISLPSVHNEVRQQAYETPPLLIMCGRGAIRFLNSALVRLLDSSPTWWCTTTSSMSTTSLAK